MGALTMTKDLGEGLYLHCILPRASPDIKKFMALHSFIAPVRNYLSLCSFYSQETHLKVCLSYLF